MLLTNTLSKVSPLALLLVGRVHCAWKAILSPEFPHGLMEELEESDADFENLLKLEGQEIEPAQFIAEFPINTDFKLCAELKSALEEFTTADYEGTIDVVRKVYGTVVEAVFKDELASVRGDATVLGAELKLINKTLGLFTMLNDIKEGTSAFIDHLFCHLRSFVKRWHCKKTMAWTESILGDLSAEETEKLYRVVAEYLRVGMLARFPSGSKFKISFEGVEKSSVSAEMAREGQDLEPLRLYLEGVASRISREKAVSISEWIVLIADPLSYTVFKEQIASTGIQPAAGASLLMQEQLSKRS